MRRALAALALAGLAGCAWLEPPAQPTPPAAVTERSTSGRSAAHELMSYLARVRTLTEAQLVGEAARQRQRLAPGPGDLARVKAALALTLAHQEETEIMSLTDPVARRESADPDLRAMAGFLHMMAADRRRLRESAAAAGARLRDERRVQEAMKQKADAAAERAAQLQQKLDALTEIERSLSDRQVPTR